MNEVLERNGAHVDAFYYCPHHPEHGIGLYKKKCHCRKPETGMFEMAERDLPEGIDKVHSYMIGDKRIDAQAGKNFGVTGVDVYKRQGRVRCRMSGRKGLQSFFKTK